MNDITSKISLNVANVTGINLSELLQGAKSYQDIKRKIEQFAYKAARATSVSNYGRNMNLQIDSQIVKLDQYIDLIDSL